MGCKYGRAEPVQKTMFIGLPRDRKAPFAKSPRREGETVISFLSIARILDGIPGEFKHEQYPNQAEHDLGSIVLNDKRQPVSAMIAQVVSPTSDPNWTNRAG